MPRASTMVEVTLSISECRAIKRALHSFLCYYDEHCNNKTWRTWVGNVRPPTIESAEAKMNTILQEQPAGVFLEGK